MTQSSHPTALIVVDLGYGDAGKGTMTEALAAHHDAHTVVRFNGGAQAGHNIVAPDGRHHTFSQFGSATLLPGVRTHLSQFMVVHPLAMLAEEEHLRHLGVRDAFARTTCDERAPVITPFHQATNRLRELARGDGRHGSCGIGVGETMSDLLTWGDRMVRAGDLRDPALLRRKLADVLAIKREDVRPLEAALKGIPPAQAELELLTGGRHVLDRCVEAFTEVARRLQLTTPADQRDLLRRPGAVVFEGAQGVLLDEWHGFHPYTTWSTTTFHNALAILDEAEHAGPRLRVGVTRAYATRHGPGPFVTWDRELTDRLPDSHNAFHPWQRHFRVGWLDLPALRYALEVCGGADLLAVTHLDRLAAVPGPWPIATAYTLPSDAPTAGLLDEGPRGQLTRVVPAFDEDLDRQRRLTDRLLACAPVYDAVAPDPTAASDLARCMPMLKRLEDELGVRVGWVSSGPTRDDKQPLLDA